MMNCIVFLILCHRPAKCFQILYKMASGVMMVAGTVLNAVAFTGGNFLFSQFDKSRAQEEAKRHNAAMEKVNKERTKFNIKRARVKIG